MRLIALSNRATAENEMTKPSAIRAGRSLPVWPTDAPSRIGSIGSVQGAAMVTTPASRARTRLNIGQGSIELSMVLRHDGAMRYLLRISAPSRVRETRDAINVCKRQ